MQQLSIEYEMKGVIEFLQKNHQEQQIVESEYEIEKLELREKVQKLEAEQTAYKQMNQDLMKRIKMLEYCLQVQKTERGERGERGEREEREERGEREEKEREGSLEVDRCLEEDTGEVVKYLREVGLEDVFEEIQMGEDERQGEAMSEYREWQEIGRVSHLDSIRSISIYNSNYLISAGDDCLIRIWDITRLETNKQIHNIMSLREHNAPVFTSILLNDILYTAGLEGVIKAWDIAGLIADTDTNGQSCFTYEVHMDAIWGLECIGHTGLVSCGSDGITNIYRQEQEGLQLEMEINIERLEHCIVNTVLVEREWLWMGVYNQGRVLRYDLNGRSQIESIQYEGGQVNVIRQHNNNILLGGEDGLLRVIDTNTQQQTQTVRVHASVSDVRVQDQYVITSGYEGDVKLWDNRWMQESVFSLTLGQKYGQVINQMALEREYLFLGCADGAVAVLSTNL